MASGAIPAVVSPHSIPSTTLPQVNVARATVITQKILTTKPALIMSPILNLPLPKTMALGGVATGNMKAIEQAMAPGTINNRGSIFKEIDTDARTGMSISAVAVFEVNSVRKDTPRHNTVINNRG